VTSEEFINSMNAAPERLAAPIDDAMRTMAEPCYVDIRDNFLGAHDPDGSDWPTRKDPKPAVGWPRGGAQSTPAMHPLLIDTGALSEAAGTPDAPGSICEVSDATLMIGVNKDGGEGGIPGAAVHNYGYFEKNIAQREYLGIREETAEICDGILLDKCLEAALP
jgi:hypothetical protein